MQPLQEIVVNGREFGGVPADLRLTLTPGYTCLVGVNNSGKSQLLQLAFVSVMAAVGADGVAFVGPDRDHLQKDIQPGGSTLGQWNRDLHGSLSGPIPYFGGSSPDRSELFRLLINHDDLRHQLEDLEPLLLDLGFPDAAVRDSQNLLFDNVAVGIQGKGLRAVLPILAALTDKRIRALIIDEPETGLEPRIQRRLRERLANWADEKLVLVATHSHLFLNRRQPGKNFEVTRDGNGKVKTVEAESTVKLAELAFTLLGSSVEDLFFPGNFLVVEGASDQIICERVLEILGARPGAVKVFAAGGISEAGPALAAIVRTLRPLLAGSPYAARVVCLVDKPGESDRARVDTIANQLGHRLIELPASSIEEFLPEELYARIGRDKAEVLDELKRLGNDRSRLNECKRDLSTLIAQALHADDLRGIPELHRAVAKAIEGADPNATNPGDEH